MMNPTPAHPRFSRRLLPVLLLALTHLLGAGLHAASAPPEEIIAQLAAKRLEAFQWYSAAQQSEYHGLIRYLSLIASDPAQVQQLSDIGKEYGDYAEALNRSLLSAFYDQRYLGNNADTWVYACPPVFWDLDDVMTKSPQAAAIMFSDYLLAFANASPERRNETTWGNYKRMLHLANFIFWRNSYQQDENEPPSPKLSELDVLNVCRIVPETGEEEMERVSRFLSGAWSSSPHLYQLAALPLAGSSLLEINTNPAVSAARQRFSQLTDEGMRIERLDSRAVKAIFPGIITPDHLRRLYVYRPDEKRDYRSELLAAIYSGS
ncbi:MAG: hypothetical protein Q7Q73_15055 [Verrucomicrobiota bacterium JB024]|nr:hypothetical protein [Verrucomicrobiota bacterium JB024]